MDCAQLEMLFMKLYSDEGFTQTAPPENRDASLLDTGIYKRGKTI